MAASRQLDEFIKLLMDLKAKYPVSHNASPRFSFKSNHAQNASKEAFFKEFILIVNDLKDTYIFQVNITQHLFKMNILGPLHKDSDASKKFTLESLHNMTGLLLSYLGNEKVVENLNLHKENKAKSPGVG